LSKINSRERENRTIDVRMREEDSKSDMYRKGQANEMRIDPDICLLIFRNKNFCVQRKNTYCSYARRRDNDDHSCCIGHTTKLDTPCV
jgi:hypothetical protein